MKQAWTVVVLIAFGVAVASAQQPSVAPAQAGAGGVTAPTVTDPSQMAIVSELNSVVSTAPFVPTPSGSEYKLAKKVELGAAKASPASADMRSVDFQVGSIGEKPAFVTIEFAAAGGAETEKNVNAAISKLKWQDPRIQSCAIDAEPVCVERNSKGECTKKRCPPPPK